MSSIPSSSLSSALAVLTAHSAQPSRSGGSGISGTEIPVLPSVGNDSHARATASWREEGHPLQRRGSWSAGTDHLRRDARSLRTCPALPDTSVSLPVRRITLPAPPARHMADTMHAMHSRDPGSGATGHPLQSTTRQSPSTAAGGMCSASSPRGPKKPKTSFMDASRRHRI